MTRDAALELQERLNARAPEGVRYEAIGPAGGGGAQLALDREPVSPWYVRRVVERGR